MIDFETKKVLFIDLDSTLIKTISGKTFPEDITDFRVQLPVLDKIIEKMPNLNMFFIVSNQGGLKTLTDKRIFNYKIWAVEGICHGYPRYNPFNIHLIIRDKDNPWYIKFVTSSQYPYYEALCGEELQRYIKNARQFFKTTKNEKNFYFSSSYGVLNVL